MDVLNTPPRLLSRLYINGIYIFVLGSKKLSCNCPIPSNDQMYGCSDQLVTEI